MVVRKDGEFLVPDVGDVLDVGLDVLDGRAAQLHQLELTLPESVVPRLPVLVIHVEDVFALQLDLLEVLTTRLGQLQHVALLVEQLTTEVDETGEGQQHEDAEEDVVHEGPVEDHYNLL